MPPKTGRSTRCAIYTRKSTDHGLELEFNSLDAQREACEAYVKSQQHEGWQALRQRYDDPAYSGGSLDRPALQQLLVDIDAGRVDVVVVYKIDRLTRSLADFAKLVEVFDRKGISFVAVTQQFNTTTSMGRLTLNVLLSFAQFERELSSERVRDKIAASRKKGKWTGGTVPLGYEVVDKKLVINESEAKTVKLIYDQYLSLKSIDALVADLDSKRIVTKSRRTNGKSSGGVGFAYGSLAYLLKNRTYLGETGHKGSWFGGEHEPILDRETFDQVQELLKTNSITRVQQRHDSGALLAGLLFDDRGNRMSPSYTTKNGVRYLFYVSAAILRGRKANAGSVARVSATEIEAAVLTALQSIAKATDDSEDPTPRILAERHLDRVVVSATKLTMTLLSKQPAIELPWSVAKKSSAQIDETHAELSKVQNPQLVQAVVRAHAWARLLMDGTYDSIEALARATDIHPKIVRNSIRLAFLAPDITAAILTGEQPQSLSLTNFKKDIPLDWTAQRRLFSAAATSK